MGPGARSAAGPRGVEPRWPADPLRIAEWTGEEEKSTSREWEENFTT